MRHLAARGAALLAAIALTATALGACSGSSSKSAKGGASSTTASVLATTTSSTDSGSTTSTSGAAATTTVAGKPSGAPPTSPVTVPPSACLLLSSDDAFQVIGTVRDATASHSGSIAICTFQGVNGKMTVTVQRAADIGAAQNLIAQAVKAASTAARGLFGVGDAGVQYPGGLTFRSGTLVVTLSASPAPNSSLLITAARAAQGRL